MADIKGGGKGPADRKTPRDTEPGDPALIARYRPLLESFFLELAAALGELCREVEGLEVSMKKNPDEILSMIPRFLHLQEMSLAEIQYAVPGTSKRPGIRFWFEGPEADKRLRAVLFEDTRIWEVSYSLQKLCTELGTFSLGDGEIVAHAATPLTGKPGGGPHWRAFLRVLLRSPIPAAAAKGKTEPV